MTNHKDNPAEIYLVPVFDGEYDHVWSDTPAPGEGMKEEDATRYVREDLVPTSNEVLARRIVELTNERDQLKAQVEQLENQNTVLKDKYGEPESYKAVVYDIDCADEKIKQALIRQGWVPPEQITEIKAQAYEDGGSAQKAFWDGFERGAISGSANIRAHWDEYLQIRQQAKAV